MARKNAAAPQSTRNGAGRRTLRGLADIPFAVKMGLPAAFALIGLVGLLLCGMWVGAKQSGLLQTVVREDVGQATALARSLVELQAVNADLYRLLLLRVTNATDEAAVETAAALVTRIDVVRAQLLSVQAQTPLAQASSVADARAKLAAFRGSVANIALVGEGDLPRSIQTVDQFERQARGMVATLSQLTDDVLRDANQRAETSIRFAKLAHSIFLISVVLTCLAVGAIAAEITRRTVASIRNIARATLLIASGDQTLKVDRLARRDELGTIVESLRAFQDNNARINFLAHHDALTALPNRALLHDRMTLALESSPAHRQCAVHMLDLDHFKAVNDTLGHPIGDLLLRVVAARLVGCVREGDTVARLGGDEFAILQLGLSSHQNATDLAQRMLDSIAQPYEINGHQIMIGASVGIAATPCGDNSIHSLLRSADMALYRAKAEGRSTWRLFEAEMDAALQERRLLEIDMRTALIKGHFELYYQPLVNVKTHEVTGFEALIRWHHPERGLVTPNEFIPLAEETGMIVPIGAWALRQACRDAAGWQPNLKVAVNLSPLQFKDRNLVATVNQALGAAGLLPCRLELEITEGVLLQESEATLATLHKLRGLGISIAMDDFGTGYSSLSYLRSFPFDRIKIDQTFIRDLADQGDSAAIVRAVTGLSSSLGIRTTAEGVETEAQLAQLIIEGCTEVQGYLFSPPRPAQDVPGLVAEISRRRAIGLVPILREPEAAAQLVDEA